MTNLPPTHRRGKVGIIVTPIGPRPLRLVQLLHLSHLSSLISHLRIMRWNIGSSSASTSTLDAGLPPNHPAIAGSSKPPASCPMHTADTPAAPPKPTSAPAKCPVDHAAMAAAGKKPAAAPAGAAAAGSTGGLAKCPVQHDKPSDLNPLNHIPKELSAVKQPGQTMDLPTDRTASSIPRPKDAQGQDEGDVWDYPSPQQFYNALVRKGWETPEESIETVVAIHNWCVENLCFFHNGDRAHHTQAQRGCMGGSHEVGTTGPRVSLPKTTPGIHSPCSGESAQLSKFQGRPGELSPKAQFFLWAGKIFPSKFK
jgi:cytochrome c heme-lyase